nr:retrotransposon-related protein [Tanacetum cinerariifolium]
MQTMEFTGLDQGEVLEGFQHEQGLLLFRGRKVNKTVLLMTDTNDDPGDAATDGGDDGFKWGVQEASAFEDLKQRLYVTPVLSLPDFNEVFVVEEDASANGIGAYHGCGFLLGKVVEVRGSSVRVVEWAGKEGGGVLELGGKTS